jgi:hypothetical protein
MIFLFNFTLIIINPAQEYKQVAAEERTNPGHLILPGLNFRFSAFLTFTHYKSGQISADLQDNNLAGLFKILLVLIPITAADKAQGTFQ